MSDVDNPRVALVTGATRGIGRAIMLRLAADGYVVAGTATTDAGAQSISESLTQAGLNGSGYTLQVDDAASVAALIEALDIGPGLPLVLVNNAGVTRDNLLVRMKEDEWQTVFDTNVGGLYRLCKPLLRPMMKARWGRIINLSGMAARQAGYAVGSIRNVSVSALSKNLTDELGPQGINVTTVHPGMTFTERIPALLEERAKAQNITVEEAERQMAAGNSINHIVDAKEVAYVIAFLASPKSISINGDAIAAGGGIPRAIHY